MDPTTPRLGFRWAERSHPRPTPAHVCPLSVVERRIDRRHLTGQRSAARNSCSPGVRTRCSPCCLPR